jgi:Peptidoglycan-binding protein, CsiV
VHEKNHEKENLLSSLFKVGLFSLSLLFASAALAEENDAEEQADETNYQIEFVLFKHANADLSQLEYETPQAPYSQPSQLSYLYPYSQYAPSNNQLAPVPASAKKALSSVVARLEKSSDTEVLISGAWQQSMAKESESTPIMLSSPIKKDRTFFGSILAADVESGSDDSSLNANPNLSNSVSQTPLTEERFRGELQIKRSRYNHAAISLEYGFHQRFLYANLLDWFFLNDSMRSDIKQLMLPVPESIANEQVTTWLPISSFEFKQSRRLKEGEVHYLDHPYLGLIVTVSRVEQEYLADQ